MPRHRKKANLFLDIMQSTDSDESHSGMDEKRPCMPRGGINMPEEVQAECHNSDTLDGIPELPADEDDEDASSSANIINVEPHSQSTSTTGFIQSSSYPPQPTPGPSGYQAFAQSSQRPDVRQNFMVSAGIYDVFSHSEGEKKIQILVIFPEDIKTSYFPNLYTSCQLG